MAITRTTTLSGIVGYGVAPIEGQLTVEGEQVYTVRFVDRETGEVIDVHMSESGCQDLGAKLCGKGIIVAPASALPGRNGGQHG